MSQEQNGKSEEEGTQTEVVAKAKRRQHPAEYKLRILHEVDEGKGKGEVGALLRKEGLYSSLVREQERINYPNVCAGWLTKVIFLAKSHKQP